MVYVLAVIDTILGVGLMVLIFLHSGKDAGLSSALGGGMSAIGGTSVVQKNLDRITVAAAILFSIVTVALGFVL
ncbi:MAG: preprotein translocase subunit SecG [Thermoleophilia bacterium]|nr:preprotein translocase subunit SecG [Thermoleophilia bacterium]